MRALAEAVDRLYQLQFAPLPDGAVMNIGQVHGGDIFNSIPQELYFTIDLRSPDPVLLDSLDKLITKTTQEVAAAQALTGANQPLQRRAAPASGPQAAGRKQRQAQQAGAGQQPGQRVRWIEALLQQQQADGL